MFTLLHLVHYTDVSSRSVQAVLVMIANKQHEPMMAVQSAKFISVTRQNHSNTAPDHRK